mmetsp:Transcript_8784/g.18632  ORF Transcript_8784/g.18632 Transcript_8784/m.18632 type:complete len:344 (-) Transcript_8784:306-1337(-)
MTQLWSVYRSDMNPHWCTKNKKVFADDCQDSTNKTNNTPIEINSSFNESKTNPMRKLIDDIGTQIESIIDSSFLGVPNPQPWSPLTDKRAAALSKPVETTVEFLEGICRNMERLAGLGCRRLGGLEDGSGSGSSPFAALVLISQKVLFSVREGLANAIKEEDAAASKDLDLTEEGGFVRVPNEQEEELERSSPEQESECPTNTAKKAVVNFAKNTVLPLIDHSLDNLAEQIASPHGDSIVVTPDDCSVECSVASYVELSDAEGLEYEECPSVVTECASIESAADVVGIEVDVQLCRDNVPQDIEKGHDVAQDESLDDGDEYVIAEDPSSGSDDDGFVDLAYCP